VFRSGRDFAAWIGLVPRQDSTGASRSSGGEVGGASFHGLLTRSTGSISCVALIGRASLRELLVISCLNRIAISYRDCDTIALDVGSEPFICAPTW
jgi:hypothetical protein